MDNQMIKRAEEILERGGSDGSHIFRTDMLLYGIGLALIGIARELHDIKDEIRAGNQKPKHYRKPWRA
jgi:hypothetical protein